MFDLTSFIIILAVIIILLAVFFLIFLRLKKGSGNLTTVMFGAIYEFFNRQQRDQVEQVVEHKIPTVKTGQEPETDREKSEQQELHKYEKQDSPGSKNFIHRVAPRKMMRK